MTHREKLEQAHSYDERNLSFEDWLVEQCERDHKKILLMGKDLAQAFNRIGELERMIDKMEGNDEKERER